MDQSTQKTGKGISSTRLIVQRRRPLKGQRTADKIAVNRTVRTSASSSKPSTWSTATSPLLHKLLRWTTLFRPHLLLTTFRFSSHSFVLSICFFRKHNFECQSEREKERETRKTLCKRARIAGHFMWFGTKPWLWLPLLLQRLQLLKAKWSVVCRRDIGWRMSRFSLSAHLRYKNKLGVI